MQPWSWPRFVDFLGHFWLPVVVVGVAGTARNLRVMRADLLDILHLPYIQAARAKGLRESSVIYKHAAKNAPAPIIMCFGMSLPFLIEGAVITAVVLKPADHRPRIPGGAAGAGHAPGGLVPDDAGGGHRDRQHPGRRGAGRHRPAGEVRLTGVATDALVAAPEARPAGDSQWLLIRRRFGRHRLGLVELIIVLLLILLAAFAPFFSPCDFTDQNFDASYLPPQRIHFVDRDGRLHLLPFVYRVQRITDPDTFELSYREDTSQRYRVRLLVRGVTGSWA